MPGETELRQAVEAVGTAGEERQDARLALALGALYHALAQVTGEASLLLDALEHTERAIELDPRAAVAHFNRALIETDMGLCRQARVDWGSYLAVDADSPWADETRARRAAPPCGDSEASPRTADDVFQEAVEVLLPRWAAARENGSQEADPLLDRIAGHAERLATESKDRWLHDLVGELRRAEDPHVRAVRSYARGRALFDSEDYQGAKPHLLRARSMLAQTGSVLVPWCDLWLAGIRLNQGEFERAEAVLRPYRQDPNVRRSPRLAARIDWALGLAALRSGRLETAHDLFAEAERALSRGGYRSSAAWVGTLEAETLTDLGFVDESWTVRMESLQALQGPDPAFALHNGLLDGARAAALGGFSRAADAFLREAFDFAQESEDPWSATETLLARGDLFLSHEVRDRATEAFGRALEASRSVTEPLVRRRFETHARLGIWAASDTPRDRSLEELDEVVRYYTESGPAWREIQALRVQARIARLQGRSATAGSSLEEAIRRVRLMQGQIGEEPLGLRHWESLQDVFDEAIELALASRRPVTALALLEDARRPDEPPVDPLPFRECRARNATRRLEPAAEESTPVTVVYGLVGDQLVWWRVDGKGCRFGFGRPEVVQPAVDELLRQVGAGSVAPDQLELLYRELLSAPLLGVAESRPLVLIPDRHLLRIPFAALRNPDTQRYLIEERPLSFRTGLAAEGHPGSPSTPRARRWRVLVVGDPAFDRSSLPWLSRLPGSAVEARGIASLYSGGATLLAGEAGTAARVRAGMADRQVLHLAAHAIPGPEGGRDVLVLATDADSGSSGLVSTKELLPPGPSRLELVVLSACSTLGVTPTRSGGLAGLARPFVARGVPAVVGTLWPMDDRVLGELMIRFHRGVLDGLAASESLRRAQIESLTTTPAGRPDWAAVQLIGDLPPEPPVASVRWVP